MGITGRAVISICCAEEASAEAGGSGAGVGVGVAAGLCGSGVAGVAAGGGAGETGAVCAIDEPWQKAVSQAAKNTAVRGRRIPSGNPHIRLLRLIMLSLSEFNRREARLVQPSASPITHYLAMLA